MNRDPLHLVSLSVDETLAIGRQLGAALAPGHVLALVGPLGAGKTHFVKGLARGAGVDDDRKVTSPTFVLVNEYVGRIPLYHLDAYRLGGETELEALGFDEMITGEAAVVVEWADRVRDSLPPDHLRIVIDVTGPERREFTMTATGPRSDALRAALRPSPST